MRMFPCKILRQILNKKLSSSNFIGDIYINILHGMTQSSGLSSAETLLVYVYVLCLCFIDVNRVCPPTDHKKKLKIMTAKLKNKFYVSKDNFLSN
jgi:hypothetical protein